MRADLRLKAKEEPSERGGRQRASRPVEGAGFVESFEAVLDRFSDPAAGEIFDDAGRDAIVAELVTLGLATGEVAPADGPMVAATLSAVLCGLAQMATLSAQRTSNAAQGLRATINGRPLGSPLRPASTPTPGPTFPPV